MAASQAYIGYGTLLQRSNDGLNGAAWTTIAEVASFTAPAETVDQLEVTHMESPGRTKEYIAGLTDTGEAQFTINYNPDAYPNHSQIIADKQAGTKTYWRFILPSEAGNETWTFLAFVKDVKLNPQPKNVVTMDVTLKQSAAISIT